MTKQLIFKGDLNSTPDVNTYLQLENKCHELLRNNEIRFVGIINRMGNLITGGFSKHVDLLETDEGRRKFYMQIALEISMRKDFDDTLGKINHITTNRDNVLMITIPMKNHVILISAEPSSIAEEVIAKAHTLGFFQTEI